MSIIGANDENSKMNCQCRKQVVALLPIKQNSERVKGKNFREIAGKPLYQWILETLLSCKHIAKVLIDTDSDNLVKDLELKYPQVQIALRPSDICGSMVSMNRIIEHDIGICKDYEYFIQTHTTNPLLTFQSIDEAIEIYFKNIKKYDSIFSVNRIQARTYNKHCSPINHVLGELKRTQDLDPVYEENSNFFIFSRDSFSKTKSRLGNRPMMFETKKIESLEIDEEDDFEFVQLVLAAQMAQKRGSL